MLRRIIIAVVAAVVVYLICIFIGGLLLAMNVAIATAVGAFLKQFAGLLSILAFLWYFFVGPVNLP